MQRILTREILDDLPAQDAQAIRSRRDLRSINRLMGNARWWRKHVAAALRPGERVLEIGAGDAGFCLLPGRVVDGLDLAPRPPAWHADATWHRTAVQDFADWEGYDAVVANLILHHLDRDTLDALGAHLRRHCRVIAACEPQRARRNQRVFRLLAPLARFCEVTRHDAIVSIAAGFLEDELPRALGLTSPTWTVHVQHSFRGAYRMLAVRRD